MSMNRKQRRIQEKKAGKGKMKAMRGKTVSRTAERAATLKAQGLALKNAGHNAEAVPLLKEALLLDPSFADVHFTLAMISRSNPELGVDMDEINAELSKASKESLMSSYSTILGILRQRRQYNEAGICQEEFCRLLPDDPLALMDLGLIKNATTGGGEAAILDMTRAFSMAPDNLVIKSTYATALHNPEFTSFHPEVKEAILETFKDIYDVNLFRIMPAWFALMVHDPLYADMLKTNMMKTDQEFYDWMDTLDQQSGAFLKDPYFTEGLRLLILSQLGIEEILTRTRRYLALNFDTLVENGRIVLFEQFICALAEQCFFNEYVYNQTPEEKNAVEALTKRTAESPDRIAISLIACYEPLYKIFPDKTDILHDFAKADEHFAKLVKTQFDDPVEEEKIKQEIPAFGALADEISKAVRSQYEENPYPRWITLCTKPMPTDDLPDDALRTEPVSVLIAGCGTGRQALSAAARNPKSKITAIDLSRASIAYGMRKAKESGIDKQIDFIHADILSMADWDGQFDAIECSGVLHHMKDPFEGWKVLNTLLKPGGYFKIGLYSETARQEIVNARDFIKKHGFDSTAEGIRNCRQAIINLPNKDPMRTYLTMSSDFYATSLVRDLIFHVQEHRMTIPQIKDMMKKLGLVCRKFSIGTPDILAQYEKLYPDDPQRCNMDNWAAFEERYPLTFRSMYQFWCQKA